MALEIERKFLVQGDEWRSLGKGTFYCQGYIPTLNKQATVRIRLIGDQGYITIKGKTSGAVRSEFEYAIPKEEAQQMLTELCQRPLIEKIRYKIPLDGLTWEVDEFRGDNEGLIIAEVELEEEGQAIDLPNWIGQEVTGDPRYYNSNLVNHPFQKWQEQT